MQTPDETQPPAGSASEMHPAPADGVGPGYEVRDTNVGGILTFIVGLFIALTVTQFAMWGLLNAIAGKRGPEPAPTSPYAESPGESGFVPPAGKVTPEVALEIVEQRRQLNAEERATLGGYAGADHNTKGGPVRIPIDRAIDLIAERGIPARGGPARTEVEVNSHSGKPAPDSGGPQDKKAAPRADGRDTPEKKTRN